MGFGDPKRTFGVDFFHPFLFASYSFFSRRWLRELFSVLSRKFRNMVCEYLEITRPVEISQISYINGVVLTFAWELSFFRRTLRLLTKTGHRVPGTGAVCPRTTSFWTMSRLCSKVALKRFSTCFYYIKVLKRHQIFLAFLAFFIHANFLVGSAKARDSLFFRSSVVQYGSTEKHTHGLVRIITNYCKPVRNIFLINFESVMIL